jgi:cysteine desulfuration protein SufE
MDAEQEAIVAELAPIEDPMEKYGYLVRLGRALLVPDTSIRQEAHLVSGCQSRVWIRAELHDGRLRLAADSDAMITRGLIALLLRVFDGRTPAEIVEGDLFFLDRSGLGRHLSPARGNGLAAMVRTIRSYAEQAGGSA